MTIYTPDIAEEDASLKDLVVTGTNLLTTIHDTLQSTKSLLHVTHYDIM